MLCLTFFILPKALNTDDVRLQVGLRRLHVDELPDVVRVVFVAAVLLVVSLRLHVLRQAFGFLAVFRQQNKEINLASQRPEPVRHIVGIKKRSHKLTFAALLLLRLLLVLLDLLGDLLPLLLLHVAVEVLQGVVEGGGEQDLSVFAKLVPDLNEKLLQFHGVFKYLRVGPDKETGKEMNQ